MMTYNQQSITNCIIVLLLCATCQTSATPELVFNPSKSSSFANHLFVTFAQFHNYYADGSSIGGYICKDILQLGPGSANVYFGCAETGKSKGDWEHDGILGLGQHDSGTILLDKPLFLSLCGHGISPCMFSILLTSHGGEVQLGGYVPESIDNTTLVYTPVTSPCSENGLNCDIKVAYSINIQQIRITNSGGGKVIYTQPTSNQGSSDDTLVTIVDSGVSCTLLPTAIKTAGGQTLNIYNMVKQAADSDSVLFVKISGQEFPISLTSCVAPNGDSNLFTLGDPFFRSTLVIHDLQDKPPRLGFAIQRPGYIPASGGVVTSPRELRSSRALLSSKSYHTFNETTGVSVLSLWKQSNAPRSRSKREPTSTVGVVTYSQNQYFTVLSAGSPRQTPFIVQLDTGSALTAIFSKGPPRAPAWQIALFSLAIFAVVVGLGVGCFFFFRKNELAFKKSPK